MIQIKREPLLIAAYTLITLALVALVGLGKISWAEFLVGIGLLNVPAILGARKEPPRPSKKDQDEIPTPRKGGILGVLFLIGATTFAVTETGCGYGATACKVVDVAQANCDLWIRYLDENGQVREVQIPKDEATQLARATAKKQSAEKDGGAP